MFLKIIKTLLLFIFIVVLLFAGFLGWQTYFEFKPATEDVLLLNTEAPAINDTLTLVTWNTGYSGLGADMDFFYEGGKMVRPLHDQYEKYRNAVLKRIISFDTAAFILLQEVDTLSRRSYYENQFRSITESMPDFRSYFGVNYNAWVPVPPKSPMGKVRSGLVTLSKFPPSSVKRVSYESSYSWPMRLFQLKRCYLETRYNTMDGKELVLINTHNSAFGDAATLREKELSTLKSRMIDEYEKGNYVIIGGDWNQNPPTFDSTVVLTVYKSKTIKPGIPVDFTPQGWKYAYDPLHTTNRDVNISYKEGETVTTLIDFFVLSPNVNLQYVKTVLTGFSEADHQPVVMRVDI